MSSPAKRPAVTYQRGRKQATQSTLNYLNPDAILQQKINDLMFSREKENESINERSIEEFDSAYHEVSVRELIFFFNLHFNFVFREMLRRFTIWFKLVKLEDLVMKLNTLCKASSPQFNPLQNFLSTTLKEV